MRNVTVETGSTEEYFARVLEIATQIDRFQITSTHPAVSLSAEAWYQLA